MDRYDDGGLSGAFLDGLLSHHPGHAQQTGPLCIGGFNRLLGAEYNHMAVRGNFRHGVGEGADVGCGGQEDLFAHALACLVGTVDGRSPRISARPCEFS